MSKQSRLNKEKAAKAKANQDKQGGTPDNNNNSQRNAQDRGDGASRKSEKS